MAKVTPIPAYTAFIEAHTAIIQALYTTMHKHTGLYMNNTAIIQAYTVSMQIKYLLIHPLN
jgi:hypothetical protein